MLKSIAAEFLHKFPFVIPDTVVCCYTVVLTSVHQDDEEKIICSISTWQRFIRADAALFSPIIGNHQKLTSLLSSTCNTIHDKAAISLSLVWNIPTPFPGSSLDPSESYALENGFLFTNNMTVAQNFKDICFQTSSSASSCVVPEDLVDRLVSVCGVILRKREIPNSPNCPKPLVHTMTTIKNLHALANATSLGFPVLLEGPTGSGKTALIEYLASLTGNTGTFTIVHFFNFYEKIL